ncbi:MAG: hypothetical protein ACXIUM_07380 [Wenzhouxiangella sp.]
MMNSCEGYSKRLLDEPWRASGLRAFCGKSIQNDLVAGTGLCDVSHSGERVANSG